MQTCAFSEDRKGGGRNVVREKKREKERERENQEEAGRKTRDMKREAVKRRTRKELDDDQQECPYVRSIS